jgi:hypothetical protein
MFCFCLLFAIFYLKCVFFFPPVICFSSFLFSIPIPILILTSQESLRHTTELHPDFLDLRRVGSTMEASTAIIAKKVMEAKQKDRVLEIKRRVESDSVCDAMG